MSFSPRLRQVFVIQCVDDGLFIDWESNFCRSLKDAGRCYDREEAIDTADLVLHHGEPYVIHTFWEPVGE